MLHRRRYRVSLTIVKHGLPLGLVWKFGRRVKGEGEGRALGWKIYSIYI